MYLRLFPCDAVLVLNVALEIADLSEIYAFFEKRVVDLGGGAYRATSLGGSGSSGLGRGAELAFRELLCSWIFGSRPSGCDRKKIGRSG